MVNGWRTDGERIVTKRRRYIGLSMQGVVPFLNVWAGRAGTQHQGMETSYEISLVHLVEAPSTIKSQQISSS